jgi:predicted ATPase/DNA-binding SARP family transcriptional activator
MAHLSIRLLGPVQVSLDGQPVTRFETRKGRALLAYLAVEGDRPHRRAALAEMLWPGRPEGAARANLRHTLAKLRTAIGDRQAIPPFLLTTPDTIQFNQASDAWVDVVAFSTLLQDRQDPRPASGRQTIERLEGAVKLYRGTLLEDLSVPDSAAFEEWLLLKRERFGRQALDALRLLAVRHEQIGEYEQALEHAWRQVELEPWQEEAQRRVMRLLAIAGCRDAALAQYKACRRVLADELAIEPEEETIALYQRIRDRTKLRPSHPAPLYNLPSPLTPFVGREAELAHIQDCLLDPTCRLLTLVGPGGIGKTRLALAAGALVVEKQDISEFDSTVPAFRQGIVFVSLASALSAEEMVPTMAEACQLQLERGREQLLDYLRQKQLLLVVDNLEHLPDGINLLAEILGVAPRVKILATSRERLQVHGEHVFPIQGLAFPGRDPTPSTLADEGAESYVESYPAMQLFAGSARRVQPTFAPGASDLTTLARICRLVEGMPLALELAAAWADTLALGDILTEIQQGLDFLQTEWRDVLRRQRSLRAVFDSSWGHLGQAEQALFAQLSVFQGGFTRAAADRVVMVGVETGISPRSLSRLVSKSFIQYDQSSDRYQMHQLLRQYGAEKLAEEPAREAEVRDRHSRHFCCWLREREPPIKSGLQQATLEEIETEMENVQAACVWAAGQGHAERLSEAIGALGLYYDWRRSYQAGDILFERLAGRLSEAGDPSLSLTGIMQQAKVRILMWQSKFNGVLGNAERREQLVQEGLACLDSHPLVGFDTRLERAHLLAQLAYAQYGEDLETARDLFVRSRNLYQEIDDRCGLADVLVGLGRVARNLRAYNEAEVVLAQSLALRQSTGDHIGSAESLALLSGIALSKAEFAKSERLIRQSLAIRRDASGLLVLGFSLIRSGKFLEAKAPIAESLALFVDSGMRVMAFWAFLDLSHICLHLGDNQLARVHAEDALSLARRVDSNRQAGLALAQLGVVALAERAYALAQERCEESLSICQEVLVHPSPAACLGLAARGLGHHDEAWRHLLAHLQWVVEHRSPLSLAYTLSGIALLLADGGEVERAVEVYALAARHPFVANSRWFEDVVGRNLAAAAAHLPEETARAARARAQAADLWQAAAEWLETLGAGFGQTAESAARSRA